MLTPKQIKIFEAFLRKPYKELTYREIKEYSGENSNSNVQKAIAKFLAEELVRKKEVGNVKVYGLNLENNNVFSYFDILLKENTPKSLMNSLRVIKEELVGIEFISIVIFGSYAEGKQKEKSDLDIALFVNSLEDKKKCELLRKSAELKSILPLDIHVILKEDMIQMLRDKHENLGKQIAYKHIAAHNPAIFYSIIREGIDHGFKIVYP